MKNNKNYSCCDLAVKKQQHASSKKKQRGMSNIESEKVICRLRNFFDVKRVATCNIVGAVLIN